MAITELKLYGPNGPTLDPETWAPRGVRGADKVAQRFVYALLTPIGSVPGRPSDGTHFLSLVTNFLSEFDFYAAFAAAYQGAVRTVKEAEADETDPAEMFGTARLSNLTFADGLVTVSLSVAAADGSTPQDPFDFTLEL